MIANVYEWIDQYFKSDCKPPEKMHYVNCWQAAQDQTNIHRQYLNDKWHAYAECLEKDTSTTQPTKGYALNIIEAFLKDLNKEEETIPNKICFYYMFDNHTFNRLYGVTLDEIINNCNELRKISPFGTLSAFISHDIMRYNREQLKSSQFLFSCTRQHIGEFVHCKGLDKKEYWDEQINKWKKSLETNADVIRLLPSNIGILKE